MRQTGYLLMLVGVLIAAFGMAQLAWVISTSPDPNPNPVGHGMLRRRAGSAASRSSGSAVGSRALSARLLWSPRHREQRATRFGLLDRSNQVNYGSARRSRTRTAHA